MDGHGNEWCEMRSMFFAIKAEVSDPWAETFAFSAQKTMYGGKHIVKGDTIVVFGSENDGGPGLIASGVVTSAIAIAKKRGIARQTPRVSITVRRTALASSAWAGASSNFFRDWNDGRPETELNFKFYRQGSIVAIKLGGWLLSTGENSQTRRKQRARSHFKNSTSWTSWTLRELIFRRLELGEFFFRVRYVGFVRAAEFKQSLLTPQIRFGKFKLGGLTFCYCFLLGFNQFRERCFRHLQLLF